MLPIIDRINRGDQLDRGQRQVIAPNQTRCQFKNKNPGNHHWNTQCVGRKETTHHEDIVTNRVQNGIAEVTNIDGGRAKRIKNLVGVFNHLPCDARDDCRQEQRFKPEFWKEDTPQKRDQNPVQNMA